MLVSKLRAFCEIGYCLQFDRIHSVFDVKKLSVWDCSHGVFLDATIAVRFSEKIDFAVAGPSIVNVITHSCTSEVLDWSLVQPGLSMMTEMRLMSTKRFCEEC
jgi:hypothetical protein